MTALHNYMEETISQSRFSFMKSRKRVSENGLKLPFCQKLETRHSSLQINAIDIHFILRVLTLYIKRDIHVQKMSSVSNTQIDCSMVCIIL